MDIFYGVYIVGPDGSEERVRGHTVKSELMLTLERERGYQRDRQLRGQRSLDVIVKREEWDGNTLVKSGAVERMIDEEQLRTATLCAFIGVRMFPRREGNQWKCTVCQLQALLWAFTGIPHAHVADAHVVFEIAKVPYTHLPNGEVKLDPVWLKEHGFVESEHGRYTHPKYKNVPAFGLEESTWRNLQR
jgi:hypothetical protein